MDMGGMFGEAAIIAAIKKKMCGAQKARQKQHDKPTHRAHEMVLWGLSIFE